MRWLALLACILASTPAAADMLIVHDGTPPDIAGAHHYRNFPVSYIPDPIDKAGLAGIDGIVDVEPVAALRPELDLIRPTHGIDAPNVAGLSGAGVGVAIIDDGVVPLHLGFTGRLDAYTVTETSVTPRVLPPLVDTHGTHVAGIIGGSGAGSPGSRYSGVAPGATLIDLDMSGAFNSAGALSAFDWAIDNRDSVDILSNSWGRTDEVDGRFDPDAPLVVASDAAVDAGLLVVFSAGNRGGPTSMDSEALNPNVLAVGSVDHAGALSTFSSHGPALADNGALAGWFKPDLVAVGERIVTAAGPVGSVLSPVERSLAPLLYTEDSGTSMAAAVVSGAAALLLEADPSLTPAEAMAILRRTATDVGSLGVDHETGWGRLDVAAAVADVRGTDRDDRVARTMYDFTVATALDGTVQVTPPAALATSGWFGGEVAVPLGTSQLRVDVSWTGLPDAYRVELLPPEGLVVRADEPGGTSRSIVVAEPIPGAWRVQLIPLQAVTVGIVTIEAAATIPATVATAAESTRAQGFPDDARRVHAGEQPESGPDGIASREVRVPLPDPDPVEERSPAPLLALVLLLGAAARTARPKND